MVELQHLHLFLKDLAMNLLDGANQLKMLHLICLLLLSII